MAASPGRFDSFMEAAWPLLLKLSAVVLFSFVVILIFRLLNLPEAFLTISVYVVLLALTLLIVEKLQGNITAQARRPDVTAFLVFSMIAVPLGYALILASADLFGDFSLVGPRNKIDFTSIVAFITTVVFAPIIEELWFRGLLQQGLRRYVGVPAAIGITTVLFVIPHFSDLTGAFSSGLLSIFASLLMHRYANIVVPIILHAWCNFFLWCVALLFLAFE